MTEEQAKQHIILCPNCGSDEVNRAHHAGNMAIPETYYFFCAECGAQWGQE